MEFNLDQVNSLYKPKSPLFWAILVGIYLSVFIISLDRLIIAPAIPTITDEFNSIADVGWYSSSYLLTAGCLNLAFGKLYRLYSIKWTLVASIVIFEIGSAVCGSAPNSTAFILGRAIAGVGSAGMLQGGMLVMVDLIPLAKRPLFSAPFMLCFTISSVLGPIVGGSLTQNVSWRWCFYINLPIGGFTLLVVSFFLNIPSPKRDSMTFYQQFVCLDPIGNLFFIPSIICLILALQWGGVTYAWSAPTTIGLLVTFAVLFIMFVIVEAYTPKTAMAPGRVVFNRSILSGMVFTFLLSGSMNTVIYYLTIWFQAAKGDSASTAGLSTLPLVLSFVLLGLITAVTTQKLGYYNPQMFIAPILISIASGLLTTLKVDTNHSHWYAYEIMFGFGLGCGFQSSNLAAQTVLPKADIPLGLALIMFTQLIGGSIVISIGQTIFTNNLLSKLTGVAGLNAEQIVNSGATDLRDIVLPEFLQTVLESYSYALTKVFLLPTICGACLILPAFTMEWKNIKKKGGDVKEGEEPTTKVAEEKGEAVTAVEQKEKTESEAGSGITEKV